MREFVYVFFRERERERERNRKGRWGNLCVRMKKAYGFGYCLLGSWDNFSQDGFGPMVFVHTAWSGF